MKTNLLIVLAFVGVVGFAVVYQISVSQRPTQYVGPPVRFSIRGMKIGDQLTKEELEAKGWHVIEPDEHDLPNSGMSATQSFEFAGSPLGGQVNIECEFVSGKIGRIRIAPVLITYLDLLDLFKSKLGEPHRSKYVSYTDQEYEWDTTDGIVFKLEIDGEYGEAFIETDEYDEYMTGYFNRMEESKRKALKDF